MSNSYKIGANDQCPCYSGEKFKKCCSGKVDWQTIIRLGGDNVPHLAVRGRNLFFIQRILEALQIDSPENVPNLKQFKSAFTASAVRKIHEAVMEFWPPNMDIVDVLAKTAGSVSGLYIGDYTFQYVTRAVVRHSTYANRILLVDPFIYPTSVNDEFNPILNPDQHRSQTLKHVNLWLALYRWIDAGMVAFIRTPADFDPRLNWDLITSQDKKFEASDELKSAARESVEVLTARHSERMAYEQLLLGAPDSILRHKFAEAGLSAVEVDAEIEKIQAERDGNPHFLEPVTANSGGQVFSISSGAAYPIAVMTSRLTQSYLFTDIRSKWKEIEIDRQDHSAENKVWAPFAKAMQEADFKYLENLRLEHALSLRAEGRLESLRNFLAKVWKDTREDNHFDSANAIRLAEQLKEEVRKAETEWKQIDTDVLKMAGVATAGGLLSAGPLVAAGHAIFLAAASVVGLAVPLVVSTRKRFMFPERFPAAFFMQIDGDA
jgi:hypothetical protein